MPRSFPSIRPSSGCASHLIGRDFRATIKKVFLTAHLLQYFKASTSNFPSISTILGGDFNGSAFERKQSSSLLIRFVKGRVVFRGRVLSVISAKLVHKEKGEGTEMSRKTIVRKKRVGEKEKEGVSLAPFVPLGRENQRGFLISILKERHKRSGKAPFVRQLSAYLPGSSLIFTAAPRFPPSSRVNTTCFSLSGMQIKPREGRDFNCIGSGCLPHL